MPLPSSSDPVYMPILKWKRGEQMAVRDLSEGARQRMLPLVEVQDRPFDWERGEEGSYTRSWDLHLSKIVESTAKYWGTDFEIAVDQPMEEGDVLSKGSSAWNYLFRTLWSKGVLAVPVISSLASRRELIALRDLDAPPIVNGRFVLRFRGLTDSDAPSLESAGAWFRDTLKRLRVRHADVDAVLDLGYLSEEGSSRFESPSFEHLTQECADALESIGLQGPWRSLTLASGAFPENLAGTPVGVHRLPRRDWQLYRRVERLTGRRQGLVYGDYGISYTDVLELDPRLVRMSASLRYTHTRDWVVYKARNVKDHGFEQYRDLCKILVNGSDPYMGRHFSEGDMNYFAVAHDESVGPGNATIWRRDATNHHIHMVLNQLSDL